MAETSAGANAAPPSLAHIDGTLRAPGAPHEKSQRAALPFDNSGHSWLDAISLAIAIGSCLFLGGTLWTSPPRQGRCGYLLAGSRHRGRRLGGARTESAPASGGRCGHRDHPIQPHDWQERVACGHFWLHQRGPGPPHGPPDRAQVRRWIQVGGCAPGARLRGGERGWGSYGRGRGSHSFQPCQIQQHPRSTCGAFGLHHARWALSRSHRCSLDWARLYASCRRVASSSKARLGSRRWLC